MKTIRTALVLALAFAVTALVPTSALALSQPVSTAVHSQYQGWAYTRHHCSPQVPGTACTMDFQYREAYRWNGRSWTRSDIGEGTQVYAWPYAGEWHWVWTAQTGWLAMRTRDLQHGR